MSLYITYLSILLPIPLTRLPLTKACASFFNFFMGTAMEEGEGGSFMQRIRGRVNEAKCLGEGMA